MLSRISVLALAASALFAQDAPKPMARFHHVHLNVVDPKASIEFYTTKFSAEKAKFAGLVDAVYAQKSWLLFQKVNQAAPSDLVSTIWHIGWGAEDMKAEYDRQLKMGTKFATPITDISDIGGRAGATGQFYYAYVDGPDHELIELNTARHHNFGHMHLFSDDPVAAAEWYEKHFGVKVVGKNPKERLYRDIPIGPSASLMMDNVNIIIYPVAYIKNQAPELWKGRTSFESTKGRVIDHIGFSVDNLDESIQRLKAEGVKVTAEPRSIAGGKIKFAFVEGPDKMSIEVIEGHPETQKLQ
jgi:catechol 2,3-dioxygenase-like lactoylglutathione lyase family enzyme